MRVIGLRATVLKVSAFAVVSALLLLMLYNTMTNSVSGGTNSFSAVFTDVSGLRPGDDVRVAGVRVGRVESIAVDGRRARVDFVLSKSQPLLSTTELVMRYQNLVGQRYLAMVQGPKRGAPLHDGSVVPLTRTSPGFDLTALLNGFRPLFEVLQPAGVNKLSASVIKVLQGEGGSVDQLLRQTADLTGFLADRDKLFQQVAANLTPVLVDLAGQGTELKTAVDELGKLMSGLARNRQRFGAALDGVIRLVTTTSSLAHQAEAPTVRDVKALRAVAAMYAQHSSLYGKSLPSLGKLLGTLARTFSYKGALNSYLCSLDATFAGVKVGSTSGSPPKYSKVCR